MTTDLDALLAAVLAAPADDAVRLIYADALDEAGQHDRAEFIRVQCELASLDAAIVCHQPGAKLGDACNDLLCPRCGREHELYRRSEQLLARHANDWFPFGPDEPAPVSAGSPLLTVRHGGGHMRVEYRRGFVGGLECGSEFWVAHGDTIRARHPVERVTLTTEPQILNFHQWLEIAGDHERLLLTDTSVLRCRFHPDDVAERVMAIENTQPDLPYRRAFLLALLALRWPGVAFTLPEPENAFRLPNGEERLEFTPVNRNQATPGEPLRFTQWRSLRWAHGTAPINPSGRTLTDDEMNSPAE